MVFLIIRHRILKVCQLPNSKDQIVLAIFFYWPNNGRAVIIGNMIIHIMWLLPIHINQLMSLSCNTNVWIMVKLYDQSSEWIAFTAAIQPKCQQLLRIIRCKYLSLNHIPKCKSAEHVQPLYMRSVEMNRQKLFPAANAQQKKIPKWHRLFIGSTAFIKRSRCATKIRFI